MSRAFIQHPGEEELLRLADGELAARRASAVRSHLEACWQCRTGFDEIQEVVGDCVRYRQNVLHACLPPPPAPWMDIEERLAAIDAAERLPLSQRIARWLPSPARWVPVAVALALACALFYELKDTPKVQAAVLLRRAADAAKSHPRPARRIRIRTGKRDLVRAAFAPRPDSELEGIFRKANYNWEDPLSARSFQSWRESLPEKRDEVTTSGDTWQIRTATGSGELAEATLTLRSSDLQPVQERMEFRDRDWIEITELPAGTVPPRNVEAGPSPRREQALPSVPRRDAPDALTGELEAMAALHGVGADLGDPVEVSRSGSQVLVTGVGIAPQRQQQIRQALDGVPNVVVRFPEPPPETQLPEKRLPERAETAAPGAFQARLEAQVGGRPAFERLSAQLLDTSDALMSRVYAMRRLAQHFPPDVERQLTPAKRRLLAKLNQEHAAVVIEKTAALEGLAGPALVSLGGIALPAAPAEANGWQSATEQLFRSARRIESLLAAALGVTPGEPAGAERLPSEVLTGLSRLRADAAACQMLLAGN
jgi:hypothetical protein